MPPHKNEARSLSYQPHRSTNVRAETSKAPENCRNVSEHWDREEFWEKKVKIQEKLKKT